MAEENGLLRLTGLWANTGKTSGKVYLGGKTKDDIHIPAGSRIMVFSRIPQAGDSARAPHYSVCYAMPDGYVAPSHHLHQPLQEQTADFQWPHGQPQPVNAAQPQQMPQPQPQPQPVVNQQQQPVYTGQQPAVQQNPAQVVQAAMPGAQVTVKENAPF